MHHGLVFVRKGPRAFKHHVHVKFAPRNFLGITGREHTDTVAVDGHPVRAFGLYFRGKAPMHRVVAQQVRIDFIVTRGIHRHNLKVTALSVLEVSTQHIAADTSETVDRYTNRHLS